MDYYFKHRDHANPELDKDGNIINSLYYGPFETEDEAAVFFSLHSDCSISQARLGVSKISDHDKQYMIDNPQEAVGALKVSFLHPSEAGYYMKSYFEWQYIIEEKGPEWFM